MTVSGLLLVMLIMMASHSEAPVKADQWAPKSTVVAPQTARGDAILQLLKANYVHPADVTKVEGAIRVLEERHSGLDDESYARVMGPKLSELLRDRHLLLEYSRRPIAEKKIAQSTEPDAATKAKAEEFARRVNYGLTEVKVLDGNIGYLRIDGFLPPNVAGEALGSAMESLRHTRGLVIDLRESVNGGDPRMVALLCAYFIPDTGKLLTTISWRQKHEQESRIPELDRAKVYSPNAPVYVLTSRKTFSAGEELAYNLKVLNRAKLIGEPTGGGANPGSEFRVSDHLSLFIPEGQAINATTGSNWNWTGVTPHERINPSKALERTLQKLAVR